MSGAFHKPFFIGRKPYVERARRSRRHVLRLLGQGRKTLRPGHVILDESGKPAGQVTSFAYVHEDMTFFVLACVSEEFRPGPGAKVRGARLSAGQIAGPAEDRSIVELTALARFPEDAERRAWPTRW